jgi:pimeloyl-ACP methyl ester carboxylesterase
MRTKGFIDVPDGYLYYEQSGTGPDVVLLNGGLADVRMWDSTVSWLSDSARVTTWDCRDRGLSSTSVAPYSELDDLAAVMDAAGIDRAVLVGVSDGGRQALAFACHRPERVVRVGLVAGSFGEFPDPSVDEEAARVVMRAHFARQAELLAIGDIPAAAANDIAAWCPAVNESDRRLLIGLAIANSRIMTMTEDNARELDPPVKTRFAEIAVPVSVLVGGQDFQGTQLWAARIADQIPQAELTVLPEADHMPMFSAPAAFRQFVSHVLTPNR